MNEEAYNKQQKDFLQHNNTSTFHYNCKIQTVTKEMIKHIIFFNKP